MKSNNKTIANSASVDEFIAALEDQQQAADSRQLIEMFSRVTSLEPVMWGDAMIGYGTVKLTYASGREVDWFSVGFSPRKSKLTLYVTFAADELTSQFANLGKYKTGKGCIYINKLADVDKAELEKLVAKAYQDGWQNPQRSDGREQTVKVEPSK